MALNLIFMGTPEFAVPILESINNSDHKLLFVYTQPPKKSSRGQKVNFSSVNEYCVKNKIAVKCPKIFNEKEIKFLKDLKPDVVIVAAYGKILPKEVLDLKNIKFINIHASLLPRWRGAAPIQRSIIEMDQETGISIMKIVPKLDSGPFILQEKIKIEKNDNYLSIRDKLSILGSKLTLKTLHLIESGKYTLTEQDESRATYAKKIEKKESEINWNVSSRQLIAKINGLNPYPGTWFRHKNSRFKIIQALEVNLSGEQGVILDDILTIACKENAIRILKIQREGKKILKSKDFLAGYKLTKGEKLT